MKTSSPSAPSAVRKTKRFLNIVQAPANNRGLHTLPVGLQGDLS